MEINLREIAIEISKILSEHNITFEYIDTVLEQSSQWIKSRTEIKTID